MSSIRDRALDEAIAIAKACSHPEVELRHLLWGLARALGNEAPDEVSPPKVRPLLDPAGSAFVTPVVTDPVRKVLAAVDSVAAAQAAALDLARRLGILAPATGSRCTIHLGGRGRERRVSRG